jgi:hypothetical protein
VKKYDKVKRVGHEQNKGMFKNPEHKLIFKEKLDGANFRWTFNEDNELVCGSRNVEYTDPDDVDKRFRPAIEKVTSCINPELVENFFGHTDLTFFGENMVPHSLEYEWDVTPQVIGFDIYDHRENKYLDWETVHGFYQGVNGLAAAAITNEMTVEEYREYRSESEEGDIVPESEWRNGKAEGVIIINTDMGENDSSGFNTRAKEVTEEFLEEHRKATGATHNQEKIPGHEELVNVYCTNARIEKHVHKMRDEGRELAMNMMENHGESKGLPIRVSRDIVEEEADFIVGMNDPVDFKDFRSAVANRCVKVLKNLMAEEAMMQ